MFSEKELQIIKLVFESELEKYKAGIYKEKIAIYKSIIDKCKSNQK